MEEGLERKTQVFRLDMIYIYEDQDSENLNFCARETYGAPI